MCQFMSGGQKTPPLCHDRMAATLLDKNKAGRVKNKARKVTNKVGRKTQDKNKADRQP
jgi:hypothetical protein